MHPNTFGSQAELQAGTGSYTYYRLQSLIDAGVGHVDRLPFSLKILLENLLRYEDGRGVTRDDIEALASVTPKSGTDREIAFTPARVMLQDFTVVPVVVHLASIREAIQRMGGDPQRINPLQPVDLVIDHSVPV